jgi:hypothetical protein
MWPISTRVNKPENDNPSIGSLAGLLGFFEALPVGASLAI